MTMYGSWLRIVRITNASTEKPPIVFLCMRSLCVSGKQIILTLRCPVEHFCFEFVRGTWHFSEPEGGPHKQVQRLSGMMETYGQSLIWQIAYGACRCKEFRLTGRNNAIQNVDIL
jgi:hypothetical protein